MKIVKIDSSTVKDYYFIQITLLWLNNFRNCKGYGKN